MTNQAVTQATNEILEAFRTGRLAEPLAQTFLHSGLHCETLELHQPDAGPPLRLRGRRHLQAVAGAWAGR
ncbi:MAG: hypothetical protein V9H69_10500 [Anaerolineae bacterium]